MWPSSRTVCMNLEIYIIIPFCWSAWEITPKLAAFFFLLLPLRLVRTQSLVPGALTDFQHLSSHIVVVHTIYMLPVGYLLISHISFHINAVGTQVHLCCISAPRHQSLWEQCHFFIPVSSSNVILRLNPFTLHSQGVNCYLSCIISIISINYCRWSGWTYNSIRV